MKIVCLGDSLTEGYDITKSSRWSDLLMSDLDVKIINSGIGGDTTAGMLARFHNMVVSYSPTHVIIMGGTNDIWMKVPNELTLSNIMAMTRHARHFNIVPIIGIPTSSYCEDEIVSDIFIDSKILNVRVEEYRNMLIKFSEEDNQMYIDFSKNMTSEVYLGDGLHPNEEGQVIMKENAKVLINKIISGM